MVFLQQKSKQHGEALLGNIFAVEFNIAHCHESKIGENVMFKLAPAQLHFLGPVVLFITVDCYDGFGFNYRDLFVNTGTKRDRLLKVYF